MRVLVVLPGARGVYPREAEQRRIDVVKSYSTPEVEVEVDFPAEPAYEADGPRRDGDRGGAQPYSGGRADDQGREGRL